jgi:D-alanyl-D-alanine carboxypeptidase/D-alanyl-D-alanine-endopeptidase (penicillin-binding protein 4)
VATAAAARVSSGLSVHVVDLGDGAEVYAFGADTLRVLASNTKVFTTAAALDQLGPGYFFETLLLTRGPVVDGVLQGDLAILGSGDPNISGRHWAGDSYAVFRGWAERLRALGIRGVTGDLLLVHGFFEEPYVHPEWPRDQLTKWYEAPVSALSFNDNCVLVRVLPTRPGQLARAETVPGLALFELRNTARVTTSARQHWVGIARTAPHALRVSGSIWQHSEPVESWVAVADPLAFFGAAVRDALGQQGIVVAGATRPVRSISGRGWEIAANHRSDLLSTVEVVNKRSQNFYAESVLKHLGARRCGEGSFDAGVRVVAGFLAAIGIAPGSYTMVDGSGMSRSNRFTARQVTTLLRHMFTHRHGREFLLSLPYSGEPDLSWERRLARPPYRGNVFAKTGSLNSVSTLSGYAKSARGRIYAFSILCNGARSVWDAKRSQDRIVEAIVDHG